jgi:hypothetical protein
VVAFVDHDGAVALEQSLRVVEAAQALDHGEVNHAGRPVSAAADLSDLLRRQAERLDQLAPPLVQQRLAVHQHQRRQVSGGDDGTPHDGLARPGRCHQHTVVVAEHGVHGRCLQGSQPAVEAERQWGEARSVVGDDEFAAGVAKQRSQLLQHAPREVEMAEILLVALDEPGCLIGGEAKLLPLVERRVVQGGQVLDRREQRGRQPGLLQAQHGADQAVDPRRWRPFTWHRLHGRCGKFGPDAHR